ncbi:MAG: pantetheine-phosphate adenylyltransferase [Methanobacteriota archaeon]
MRVCLGGTFSHLHRGHEALLALAFDVGDEVFIGLASSAMAHGKCHDVPSFELRKKELAAMCDKLAKGKPYEIGEIEDEIGPAASGEFDAIVVSEETLDGARRINEMREVGGLKALKILAIGLVSASDGRPLSSTRVCRGEVGPDGTLRRSSPSRTRRCRA